ncbi:HAMP domain-containing sensor histidine kinase [Rhodohalobacter sp.]|uniref:sensor histidine kinase n=1 Tax=Rhodohalobacter sp. TaxID=1974210 RepID=UPI002ACD309F|nr:HAMP domain-containing sensor histidine kinase [Rhodohalobacter sp.]MDZ7754920.1 HAMP domain-containing sensor histidine kinase [Rhodohalobacter sp.]
MRLLNRSLQYLAVSILVVVGIWSVIFYFGFRDEVYDIVDDNLEDQLELLDARVKEDLSLLESTSFEDGMFSISPITYEEALVYQEEVFRNTLMPLPFSNDLEQVRMLTEAYQVNGQFYKYQVVSSTVEEDDLVESMFWFIIWLYIALILTIVLINNWALKKLWSPFYNILKDLKNFRVEQSAELTDINSTTTEFKELKRVADELIARTRQSYINQKHFTENAAHELQTPIAVINGKLELLLEKAELNEQDATTVGEILEITSRLNQLNKSLLLLSRIDNNQFVENERISLNTMIHRLMENLEDLSSYKHVTIQIEEDDSSLFVEANPYLTEVLFQNLLVNAINHNKPDGSVNISVEEKSIKICNTSKEDQLDSENLFKRFSKSPGAKRGNGLGLAIVKAICNLYEYKIRYSFNEGIHCFDVKIE